MTQTNPLTYNNYVTQIANLAVEQTTVAVNNVVVGVSANFQTLIPQMLNYAELRIQRDLDLLATETVNTGYSMSPGVNTVSFLVTDFVTVETISTNAGPLLSVTKEFLQNVFGGGSTQGVPQYFAMIGGDAPERGSLINIQIGPVPNSNYAISVTGTIRMESLYTSSSTDGLGTTFISTWLPDLLIMASMIFVTMYQRNFSATSDQPDMGINYETQYQALLKGAIVEEARKRFRSGGNWSAMAPATIAGDT